MSDFRYYKHDNFPPVVKNLIIINVLVWVAQQIFVKQQLTERIALWPIMPQELQNILFSEGRPTFARFMPYQIATHMFAHDTGSILHILFNMFTLWMFGRILENVWGPKRFLLFYFIAGVGAAACHLLVQYIRCEELLHVFQNNPLDPRVVSLKGAIDSAVGASGAIMGLLVAFGYLFPNTELFVMFIPIPIKAKWAVIGFAAIDILGGAGAFGSGDQIAHFAHLGGALTGFIIVLIWNKGNRRRFY